MNSGLRVCLSAAILVEISIAQGSPQAIQTLPNGIRLHTKEGYERLQVISDSIVRVNVSPSFPADEMSSIVVPGPLPAEAPYRLVQRTGRLDLLTEKLDVRVDLGTGRVDFLDRHGKAILSEKEHGRRFGGPIAPGRLSGSVNQQWVGDPQESLYGLGQQQLGVVDIKGYDLDLWQHNTNIVVPFLTSSKGYGILWDNLSYSHFGDLNPFSAIPGPDLLDKAGNPGGLTLTTGSDGPTQTANLSLSRAGRQPRVFEGYVYAPLTGSYQFNCYSNGQISVWLGGEKVMDHWRQGWLTSDDRVKKRLLAGRKYPIRIEWGGEQASTMKFTWKPPTDYGRGPTTSLWSEEGNSIDYYFVYGPSLDRVVAGYRTLTGRATMAPQWAFGLWQSRQRYETSDQSLQVVKQYRDMQIPFDNIVQDWFYWKEDQWGSHEFDPNRFPDPTDWIRQIHDLHAHIMISVWGKFYPETENAKAMQAAGFLYQPNLSDHLRDWVGHGYEYTFYDAFNPAARELYWRQIDKNLFSKGMDAWWLDATEPDLTPSPPTLEGQRKYMNPTALGPGSQVLNGYALYTGKGVFEGQRKSAPDKRVFILTRSGFAGQQRYGASSWSGDVTSTWSALKKQIAAGLGFSISGVPYWTSDTGGYTMQRKFAAGANGRNTSAEEEEWRELNARWFEFSTFCPLLRVHGELRPREMWTLGSGSPAFNAELKFDRLRYRLFPYIYSLAGAVTQDGASFMRPLVMDFPHDVQARERADEYMFGPAFLVAPVTENGARSRDVLLPRGADWYDFWTGKPVSSGESKASAPLDAMPVYVRAGSIVPTHPVEQYAGEHPEAPITLLVYAGANGSFKLYQDDGLTNAYEKGAFSQIPLDWDDAHRTLSIGSRNGTYPGMPTRMQFRIVLVTPDHPWGYAEVATGKDVDYTSKALTVKL